MHSADPSQPAQHGLHKRPGHSSLPLGSVAHLVEAGGQPCVLHPCDHRQPSWQPPPPLLCESPRHHHLGHHGLPWYSADPQPSQTLLGDRSSSLMLMCSSTFPSHAAVEVAEPCPSRLALLRSGHRGFPRGSSGDPPSFCKLPYHHRQVSPWFPPHLAEAVEERRVGSHYVHHPCWRRCHRPLPWPCERPCHRQRLAMPLAELAGTVKADSRHLYLTTQPYEVVLEAGG
mmetsp:Transcript_78510/g.202177  ORF Transcript_78510/g.202177 Transcript_78510/m.202177 type:complete len:229 (-) Transcript_78510:443-1129(-)